MALNYSPANLASHQAREFSFPLLGVGFSLKAKKLFSSPALGTAQQLRNERTSETRPTFRLNYGGVHIEKAFQGRRMFDEQAKAGSFMEISSLLSLHSLQQPVGAFQSSLFSETLARKGLQDFIYSPCQQKVPTASKSPSSKHMKTAQNLPQRATRKGKRLRHKKFFKVFPPYQTKSLMSVGNFSGATHTHAKYPSRSSCVCECGTVWVSVFWLC